MKNVQRSIAMRIICGLAVVTSGIASSLPAQASVAQSGNLSFVLTIREGKMFFNQSGPRDARPGCATADRWVLDVTTSSGQALASVVLTALSQNKPVGVAGTGTCADWGDTESVSNILLYS